MNVSAMAVLVWVSGLAMAAGAQVSVPIDASGAGPLAKLNGPGRIARAPDGSLWVAGMSSDNLFRVGAQGAITEVFKQWPTLSHAAGVAVGPDGTVFVASQGSDGVLRVSTDGTIGLVVDADGAGPGQLLDGPRELAVDAAGNLFIAGELSSCVLRVAPDGVIVQLVGPAGAGPGAPLSDARDVAVDGSGVVYVAGLTSDNVLAVQTDGTAIEVIGPAGDGAGNPLDGATSVAVAADGTLYVASIGTDAVLRRAPDGSVSKVIGAAGDGAGHVLSQPVDVAVAPDGTLYVAGLDSDNVFAVAPGGGITQVAALAGDGAGHLLDAPADLVVGADGTLYVGCSASENVFRMSGGAVTWITTLTGYGSQTSSSEDGALVLDAQGRLLVGGWTNDELVRLEPDGGSTLLMDHSGGPGSAFAQPRVVCVDPAGRAYVATAYGPVFRFDDAVGAFEIVIPETGDGLGHVLVEVYAMLFDAERRLVVAGRDSDNLLRLEHDGSVIQLLGPEGGGPGLAVDGPNDLALGHDGTIYIANLSDRNILALHTDGSVAVLVSDADVHPQSQFNPGWYHVAVDALDRVYIPGYFSKDLYRFDTDGTLTKLWEQTDGERPIEVGVDAGGAIYLATGADDDYVLRIEPTGVTTVVVGPEGDGAGHALNNPQDLLLRGPGLLDISNLTGDDVMTADLAICGSFTLLPGALPADGSGPLLTGEGSLCAAAPLLVSLTGGEPNGMATLVVGIGEASIPFKDGTLVPTPNLLLPLLLDPEGAVTLAGTWPAGVPAGLSAWLQAWIPVPAATHGFHASNGLRLDTF